MIAWIRAMWPALIFWIVLTAFGASVVPISDAKREYRATKALQANHRIVEGDVADAGFLVPSFKTVSDFFGRYVKGCVKKDGWVSEPGTLTSPVLAPAGATIAWIPLQGVPASDAARLDVGHWIDVCNLDGKERCMAFPVRAIACSDRSGEPCSAAVALKTDQLHLYLTALDASDAATPAAATTTPAPSPSPAASPSPIRMSRKIHVLIDHARGIHGLGPGCS